MKLCLGTVQFGLNYGIQRAGRPKKEQSIEILKYAYDKGINAFDCASGYGDAECILGQFVNKYNLSHNIHIVSKRTSGHH